MARRRALNFFLLGAAYVAAAGLALAAETSSTQPQTESAPIGNVARIIWLDKQTNVRQEITLTTGQAQTLGPLAIRMEKCLPDMNGQPNTDAAWLQISEPGRGNDWFKGWMVNTMPEIAALEHPRYDVQVVGCGTKSRQRSGPVAKSGAVVVGVDTESVDPANDPYAVPGVSDTTSAAEATPVAEPEAQPAAETPTPPATPIMNEAEPQPVPDEAAPAEAPVVAPKPAEGEEQELHNMMDGGVY